MTVEIENKEKLPQDGQYLVMINHRGIIDPPIIETALKNTDIFGPFNLLEMGRKCDIKRYIQISTDEVYGSIKKGSLFLNF